MDKLVQTLDCSSLQEGHKTKSCPSHQSRTRHSFLSLWLLYFSNHTKSFWGGHGSAHALYPAVTMPRKDLVTGQARTVISVSRGRKCSFGFNCLQKTFFQGIYFFPALPLVFFLIITARPVSGCIPRSITLSGGHRMTFSGTGTFSANYRSDFQLLHVKGKVEQSG